MTATERRASKVLGLACASSLALISLCSAIERMGERRKAIEDYRIRIARLAEITIDEEGARARLGRVESLIVKAEARAASISQAPISAFGQEALALLLKFSIRPSKYQVVAERRGDALELSFRCRALDLARFIGEATSEARAWAIPYASVHADERGAAEVTLRLARW